MIFVRNTASWTIDDRELRSGIASGKTLGEWEDIAKEHERLAREVLARLDGNEP